MTERDDEMLEYYAAPGPMTDLTDVPADVFDGLPTDPVGLCRTVPGLLVHEMWADAYGFDVPESRLTDLQTRFGGRDDRRDSAARRRAAVRRAARRAADGGQLPALQHAQQRVVAARRHPGPRPLRLRHVLRARQVRRPLGHRVLAPGRATVGQDRRPARRRAAGGDHRRLRHRGPAARAVPACRRGVAASAGRGRAEPDTFGIFEFWGLWFVQANVVRELAALNKMELLPWDVWGADDVPGGTGRRGHVAHRHRGRRHRRRRRRRRPARRTRTTRISESRTRSSTHASKWCTPWRSRQDGAHRDVERRDEGGAGARARGATELRRAHPQDAGHPARRRLAPDQRSGSVVPRR